MKNSCGKTRHINSLLSSLFLYCSLLRRVTCSWANGADLVPDNYVPGSRVLRRMPNGFATLNSTDFLLWASQPNRSNQLNQSNQFNRFNWFGLPSLDCWLIVENGLN